MHVENIFQTLLSLWIDEESVLEAWLLLKWEDFSRALIEIWIILWFKEAIVEHLFSFLWNGSWRNIKKRFCLGDHVIRSWIDVYWICHFCVEASQVVRLFHHSSWLLPLKNSSVPDLMHRQLCLVVFDIGSLFADSSKRLISFYFFSFEFDILSD